MGGGPTLGGERTVAGKRTLAQAAVLVLPSSAVGNRRLRLAITQRATLSDGACRQLARTAGNRPNWRERQRTSRSLPRASPELEDQTAFAARTSRQTLPSNDQWSSVLQP